jgi:transketolase C-terminal domain/subunit
VPTIESFPSVIRCSSGKLVCCPRDGIQARRIVMGSSDISIRHLHLSTIIRFPTAAVLDAATSVKYGVVTLENHSVIGGIGSATAEVLAENGVGKKLIRLGLHWLLCSWSKLPVSASRVQDGC